MNSPQVSACLILTGSGKRIVQWERESSGAAFRVASEQEFEFLDFETENGYCIAVVFSKREKVATAVIYNSKFEADKSKILSGMQDTGEAVLGSFLSTYGENVHRILSEAKAEEEAMAELYTLDTALHDLDQDLYGEEGTMSEFLAYQMNDLPSILQTCSK